MGFPKLKLLLGIVLMFVGAMNSSGVMEQEANFPWLNPETNSPVFVDPASVGTDGSAARKIVTLRAPSAPSSPMNWNFNWQGVDNWIAAILLLLVSVAAIVLLIWIASKTEVGKGELPELEFARKQELIRSLPFQLDVDIGDCRQLAERSYRQGDYRRAMIYLFSHALIYLDQHDLLRLRRGKTNRQYLRELSRFQMVANYLQTLVVPFEAVFFGNKDLSREQFEMVWQGLTSFEQQVLGILPTEVPL